MQYVYKYVRKYNIYHIYAIYMKILEIFKIFEIFQIHIYPRKFYLKNLNIFMPKVGF